MVFFTCNACGQAVKKNQVEKHYTTKCRNCTVLSCIDCGKEFCGDEYQGHVKCVTENEKYGAKDTKDVKPKPSSTKGEAKQVNWIENIKNYIAVTNLPHRISSLLNDLLNYSNIPRKKQQFQNFLSNSVRIRDKNLSEDIWEIFMKANQSEGSSKATEIKDEAQVESKSGLPESKSGLPELDNGNLSHADIGSTETVKHKKKKKKDKNEEMLKTEDNEPAEKQEVVKKHKRKHKEVVSEEENMVTGESVEETASYENTDRKSNKHRKHRKEEHAEGQENSEAVEDASTNGNAIKKHKKKRRKSEADAIFVEIDHNSKVDKSQNSHDTENDRVQDCTVETTDIVKTAKKKKSKKHKKPDNMMNGNESVAMEEQIEELKSKKAKRKSDENHADIANSIEKTAENTEHHAEGESLYKKKKKKCK